MKIQNGKLIFEEVTCWECEGKKEVTRYKLCPLNQRPVKKLPDSKCPHFGTSNRHDHKTIGEYKTLCPTCGGKGTRIENEYDLVTQAQWNELSKHFTFKVSRLTRESNFNENYLGLGILYGVTDYGQNDRQNWTDTQWIEWASTESHPSQWLQLLKDRKDPASLVTHLLIKVRSDGYSVVPIILNG